MPKWGRMAENFARFAASRLLALSTDDAPGLVPFASALGSKKILPVGNATPASTFELKVRRELFSPNAFPDSLVAPRGFTDRQAETLMITLVKETVTSHEPPDLVYTAIGRLRHMLLTLPAKTSRWRKTSSQLADFLGELQVRVSVDLPGDTATATAEPPDELIDVDVEPTHIDPPRAGAEPPDPFGRGLSDGNEEDAGDSDDGAGDSDDADIDGAGDAAGADIDAAGDDDGAGASPPGPPKPPRSGRGKGGGTRTVYARLDAPRRVAPRATFELRVGLARAPSKGVSSTPFSVPKSPFTLQIVVSAPGFTLIGNPKMPIELTASREDPYPYTVLRLKALSGSTLKSGRIIQAAYFVDHQVLGQAAVVVTVKPAQQRRRDKQPVAPGDAAVGAAEAPHDDRWPLPAKADVDLTVLLTPDNQNEELYRWAYVSRHPTVGCSAKPIKSPLIDRARFAEEVRTKLEFSGSNGLTPQLQRSQLYGIGELIASAIPPTIWQAIRRAAAASAPRPPSIQWVSADMYVPWELASVSPPQWLPNEGMTLGTQAAIGRWVNGLTTDRVQQLNGDDDDAPAGGTAARPDDGPSTNAGDGIDDPDSGPTQTLRSAGPRETVGAADMTVVSGDYGTDALKKADDEATWLRTNYRATPVDADGTQIVDAISADPASDILHFAVHGNIDDSGVSDGLLLPGNRYLDPDTVRGACLGIRQNHPVQVAFLNACLVGQGREILGGGAGMPDAFLRLGVTAVVAARWTIDDGIAYQVACEFYQAVLARDGISPAEFLRRSRVIGWDADSVPEMLSRTAYLYFGHPNLKISWKGKRHAVAGTG